MSNDEDFLTPEISSERMSQPIFEVPNWQKAYGEVLLYADSPQSAELIAYAEKEIISRYLDESSSPIKPEESRDLQEAIRVLSQLRKQQHTNAVN